MDGRVQFKNGPFTQGKMNYNVLLGQMQFIDPHTGGILSLANVDQVSAVTINGKRFIPAGIREEFMEMIVVEEIGLAIRYKGDAISVSKEGAYGSVSTAVSGSSSYSTISPGDHALTQKLTIREQIAVKLFSFCYLVKDGKPIVIKGVRTFVSTYPKDKSAAINAYVNDHKINFNSREGLIELTQFANSL